MNKEITIDYLGKAIQEMIEDYSEDVNGVVEDVLPKIGKKAVKDVKAKSPVNSGDYRKNWKMKIEKDRLSTRLIVYNKKRYMLTQLLENGHAKRDGGKMEGVPHIKPAEESAVDNALRDIKKGIERL